MGFLTIPGRRFVNIADDVRLGRDVIVYEFTNLYGCTIGDGTRIGTFVEIQKGATVGRHCRIQSHTFICQGVTIEDEVFVGHGVMFINDRHPNVHDTLAGTWRLEPVHVESGVSIGSGAVIMGGVRLKARCVIGTGAVVTHSVPPGVTVAGVPARTLSVRQAV